MARLAVVMIAAGLVAASGGVVFHNGLIAAAGVAMLLVALLVRLLQPPARLGGTPRPRFGPTTVASTIGSDAGRPIDFTPRD